MPNPHPFVADGYRRARAALESKVRAEVTSEYAERIAQASFFERIRLSFEMHRVIRRRVQDQAPPPDALY